MSIDKPLFTVFTGTYNRARYLPRVYAGLRAQTLQDFEWIIVDDGSTDDTRQTIESIAAEASFTIRYIYKGNGGVHTAHNAALQLARGAFFLRHDSDDSIVPEAMETLFAAWRSIPKGDRGLYSGVSCLCMDDHARVIGDRYPTDPWDSTPKTLENLKGEKWGFHRTEVLRKYPFPEFGGERFVPEGLVWARVGDHFRLRCINVPLRLYLYAPESISTKVPRLRYECGRGYALFYWEALARPQTLLRRVKTAANYTRTCLGQHQRYRDIIADTPRKLWTLATLPLGAGLYWRDRIRGLVAPTP